jgi:diguanylate cyclase (GGDEF)-like protein
MGMQEFWQLNMLPLGVVIFMFIFVISNKPFEADLTKRMLIPIIGLLVVIIDDNIDYHMIMTHNPGILHRIIAVIGYNMRIIILISLVHLILRNKESKKKWMIAIPGAICIFITTLAIFTDFVFYYDYTTGIIVRGPLAFTPHIILGFYVLCLLALGIYKCRHHYKEEGLIIIIGCLINCMATYVEFKYALRGILMGTIALIVVFYYMYIHVEAFKLDPLTRCFNRMTMKADSKRYAKRLKGIFVLDLNNLKVLNDTQGHQAGDLAIKTLAKTVSSCIPNDCYLYRTGGDEFVIFVLDTVKKSLRDINEDINKAMETTDYTWATGFAAFTFCDYEFEAVMRVADSLMYGNKAQYKKHHQTKSNIDLSREGT